MEKGAAFSIAGLLVSSVSAIWLLIKEMQERIERSRRAKAIVDLRYQIQVHKDLIRETIENVAEVNKKLGHPAYELDTELARTGLRSSVAKLEHDLESFTVSDEVFLREMPTAYQFGGLLGLFVGFLLQLVAELQKANLIR